MTKTLCAVALAMAVAGPMARAEESPEAQASLAARDFDLSGVRDAAASVGAGPAERLRALAAGQEGARPALTSDGLPDTSRGQVEFSMELRRRAGARRGEPPSPPKEPSRLRSWLGDRVEDAKGALKVAAWLAPTAVGAALGGFIGAAVGGPVGAGVGAAVGGAAGAVVTAGALLVKAAFWFLETWDRR